MKTIPLTLGKIASVDEKDYQRLSKYSWYARKCQAPQGVGWYAGRTDWGGTKPKTILMHRVILRAPKGIGVDHIDGNLRLDIASINAINRNKFRTYARRLTTSKYRGVSWNRQKKRWAASVCVLRVPLPLGSYDNEIDAAKAYDRAAREWLGRFARTNF